MVTRFGIHPWRALRLVLVVASAIAAAFAVDALIGIAKGATSPGADSCTPCECTGDEPINTQSLRSDT